MKLYEAYLKEIIDRSKIDLGPKPVDQADLLVEIIGIILGPKSSNRDDALKHFIYNTLPGTTDAASVKAKFLKNLILTLILSLHLVWHYIGLFSVISWEDI